ncbi:MAG: hypothetical protein IJH55_07635 [Romboutsia sp.]|nr:hypothetical protein [Romboutsia sp.]
MGEIRNRNKLYETRIQFRIPIALKQKALYKCKNKSLSDYMRKLIEKDTENIEIYDAEDI